MRRRASTPGRVVALAPVLSSAADDPRLPGPRPSLSPCARRPRRADLEIPARPPAVPGTLRAVRRPFDAIDPATWDALAAASRGPPRSPAGASTARGGTRTGGTPTSRPWSSSIRRAADPDAPVAIVPLMHRHEVEPDDAILRTRLRGDAHLPLTPVAPTAKAVFFGATYHADYATLLARPGRPAGGRRRPSPRRSPRPRDAHDPDHPEPWDVVDLRRLRCGDPAAGALAEAFGARTGEGWTVVREREDVCPVVTLEPGADFDAYLGTLDKKERHEVRRKIRRAEAAGEVRLERSTDPVADLDAFVDLHQKRWGAEGLFPPTPGGEQSRTFFRRLFELLGGGRDDPAPLPGGGRPADRGRRLVRGRGRLVPLQRRRGSRGARALARRPHERQGDRGRDPRRPAPLRLPARRRALQVRVGRRSTSPSSACSSCERAPEMGAPLPGDPCVKPKDRPPVPGGRPVRVVELLATGTNGGAQEHVYSLLRRLDREPLRAHASSRSPTAARSAGSPAWGSRST